MIMPQKCFQIGLKNNVEKIYLKVEEIKVSEENLIILED